MKELNKKIQARFDEMCATGKLFKSTISGRKVWHTYLLGFGQDNIFRDPESGEHNCNQCNNFVRRYGNIVAIDENFEIMTIFDVDAPEEYKESIDDMSKLLKKAEVSDVFFETFNELNSLPYEVCKKTNKTFKLGIAQNHKRYTIEEAAVFGVVTAGTVYTFNHLSLTLPAAFVSMGAKSIESIQSEFRSAKEVFKRGMDEISLDTMLLVKDLILQGSLLNGDAHLPKLELFIKIKQEKELLIGNVKFDNWAWVRSHKLAIAKFRNELIGVLCTELSEGEEINKACKSWNKRVDPANYMKAVAPITETQKQKAKQFVMDNGYIDSFDRRLATLEDIKVTEIKHINSGDGSVKEVSIFDSVKTRSSSQFQRSDFKKIETVTIDKFMKDILPGCSSVEALLENKHEGNLVTMTTAPENGKPIFKWDNPYSWTYKGNLAGKSMIKEAVKSQGGGVDGVLRFSIMWSEDGTNDDSDLDAHARIPNGGHIFYRNHMDTATRGVLDIDITQPMRIKNSGKKVVENITFPNTEELKNGDYIFSVHQYRASGSIGFTAEIEFDGQIFQYEYPKAVIGEISVATVSFKNGQFEIKHALNSTNAKKEMYGLDTNMFHKVNLMCLSPNYWDKNEVGNKHYFFMLDGCKADSPLRSFHNENLKSDLAAHRKVFEVLGALNMIEPEGKQLSGIGFNATVEEEVILKLKGSHKRVVKVKF